MRLASRTQGWLRQLSSTDEPRPPAVSPARGIGTAVGLLAIHAVYRIAVERLVGMDRTAFGRPVLLFEALKEPRMLLLAVPFAVLFVRRHRTTWATIGDGRVVRFVVGISVAIVAWAFATYDYNVFLDRAHVVDRLLLVGLAAVVFWTPKAVALFVPYVMLVVEQFDIPFRFGQADKSLLFKVLMLFVVFLLVRIVLDVPGRVYIFTAGITIAGNFFVSGTSKLDIGWLANDLSHLWIAAHVNGFPGWMSTETALDVAKVLERFNIVILLATVVIEVAYIALWWSKRSAPVILTASVLLHIAIFVSSGIFFWKWLVLEAAVAVAVPLIGWRRIVDSIGGRIPAVVASTALIALAPLYAAPVSLAWFDSAVTYTFEVEAITPEGRLPVARHFFSPFDLVFSQNRFAFLSEDPTLVGTFATVKDRRTAERLNDARSCRDLDRLEERGGRPGFKPRQKRVFERFVATYLERSLTPADRGLGWRALEWIQAPPHIWVQTPAPRLEADDAVDAFEISRYRTIHRDDELITCGPDVLSRVTVDVPADKSARP